MQADECPHHMKARLKKFWKDHIIDDFPYPAECFDCNAGSCQGCRDGKPMSQINVINMSQTKEFILSAMTVIMFLIIITLLFGAIGG